MIDWDKGNSRKNVDKPLSDNPKQNKKFLNSQSWFGQIEQSNKIQVLKTDTEERISWKTMTLVNILTALRLSQLLSRTEGHPLKHIAQTPWSFIGPYKD